MAIILLGGGLLTCFLGYRLLRILLAVHGFVGGVIVATLFTAELETWIAAVVTIGSGLLGSLVAITAYLAGVALAGAGLAAFAVHAVWTQFEGEPILWLMLAACFVGAIVALALRKFMIVVATSFAGAWMAIVGGLALAGNAASGAAANGDLSQMYPLVPADGQVEFALGWFGLALLAVLVQLSTLSLARAQNRAKKKKKT